ncbi:MAG: hypothetical protein HY699_14510 [Deltaproteobacteria bacterium]|nr:hypothetical protein [Deltaproteobacteria bacterium]
MDTYAYEADDPTVRPDLQVLVSRALGNGSTAVCDNRLPDIGGVPAVTPPDFSPTQAVADALSDLGCRFVDGSGTSSGRDRGEACTLLPDGDFKFVNANSTAQFCAPVAHAFAFPPGDTLVTVQLRDMGGNFSLPAQMIVRVPLSE